MTIRTAFLTLGACLSLTATAFAGGHADSNAAAQMAADEAAAIQLTISQIQAGRQQIVAENLPLTAEQAPAFWETYREYANERAKLSDQELSLIMEFRNNFDDLSEESAKELVDDYLKLEQSTLKLKKKYLGKFRKVLSQTQTLRYFQIENKLDDILAYEVAQIIPLAY